LPNYRDSSSTTASGVASFTCPRPPLAVEGDVLIACQNADVGSLPQMAVPSGWQLLIERGLASGSALYVKAFWKVAGAAEPATYTFTQDSGADGVVGIIALSSAAATTPVSASSTDASTNTIVTPSVTPTGADDFEVRWVGGTGGGTGNTWSAPATYTERIDRQSNQYTTGCMATKALASAAPSGIQTFTASNSQAKGIGLTIAVAAGSAGSTPKAASDSATVSEAASLTVAHTRTDTASLTETATAGPRAVDQAALSETSALAVQLSRTDAAALAESAALAPTLTRGDAAIALGVAALAAASTRTDAAILAETAGIGLTATDSATLAEQASKQEILGPAVNDQAALAEAAALAVQLTRADTAALNDQATISVQRTASDHAALTDQASAGPLAVDQAALTDSAALTAEPLGVDAAALIEAATVHQPITAADTATLTEAAVVTDLGREITAVGAPYRTWKARTPERRWSAHPPRRAWAARSPSA
jgi:hypothetical protein